MTAQRKKTQNAKQQDAHAFGEMQLKLEDGRTVTLDVTAELRIPDDSVRQIREARRAPAQLAFWRYQADRARLAVRNQQQRAHEVAAECDQAWRVGLDEGVIKYASEHNWTSKDFGLVQSRVNADPNVRAARNRLATLQFQCERLESVADAMQEKCFMLRRLLAIDPEKSLA